MPKTYLKDHYLEDHKLGQRALLELGRALRTGRLIAFTGAMTTEAFGYGSWNDLREKSRNAAIQILDRISQPSSSSRRADRATSLINSIDSFSKANPDKLPAPVATSLIEEVLEAFEIDEEQLEQWLGELFAKCSPEDRKWPLDDLLNTTNAFDLFDTITAWHFRRHSAAPYAADEAGLAPFNTPRALVRNLGVRRFATLNYDFELERETMLPDQPIFNGAVLTSPFDKLAQMRRKGDSDYFSWNLGSGRIRRVLPNGTTAESDIRNRERVDRMLEFAIGTDDVDYHTMHLHGRACTPPSMIVSRRDYNRLYRNNDLHRLPFEHASRILFGGNPVLFLGLGMTEAEVNRELEEFISTNPYRRTAPTFLLWNTNAGGMDEDTRRMRRLDWLNRLGVLAIFDSDLKDLADCLPALGAAPFVFATRQRTPEQELQAASIAKDTAALRHIRERFGLDQSLTLKLAELQSKLAALPQPDDVDRLLREDLVRMVKALPDVANVFLQREEYIPAANRWRSMVRIIPGMASAAKSTTRPTKLTPPCLWRTVFPERFSDLFASGGSHFRFASQSQQVLKEHVNFAERRLQGSDVNFFQVDIQPTGSGRGWTSKLTLEGAHPPIPLDNRLLINGGFSFDTDSLLHGIDVFLRQRIKAKPPVRNQTGAKQSRSDFFRSGVLNGDEFKSPLLIILNGVERFFSTEGTPLSAELDELLQIAARAKGNNRVRWIISGSKRVKRYFEEIKLRQVQLPKNDWIEFCERITINHAGEWPKVVPALQMAIVQQAIGHELREEQPDRFVPSEENIEAFRNAAPALARELDQAMDTYRAHLPGAISGDIKEVRKIFHQIVLLPSIQEALFGSDRELAMECLRAMAFLGTPSEIAVLIHVPRIYAVCSKHAPASLQDRRDRLSALLTRMSDLGLIVCLEGFSYHPCKSLSRQPQRYALHRSLMAELRASFGVPLSEAKLSTAFNMSLYVAQPIDGYVPEPEVHDELGELIDHLVGAYKDTGTTKRAGTYGKTIPQHVGPLTKSAVEHAFKDLDPVRYRQDETDNSTHRRECFHRMCRPEHVQCLRAALAVIRGYYSTTGLLTLDVDDRLAAPDRNGVLQEHVERLDALIDGFGKQAQAREAVRTKLKQNPELFMRQFGWTEPFYADELVWLHNERGVVMLAMGDLYEARRAFNLAMDINRSHVEYDFRGHNWRRIRLNQLTVDVESAQLDLASRKIEEIEAESNGPEGIGLLREDRLARAICVGYSGFVWHMRGHRVRATKLYNQAIRQLDGLHELRAQAYFGRLRAQSMTFGKPREERLFELDRMHDLALSGRQMDLAYRIQVQKADTMGHSPDLTPRERRRAIRMLDDAVRYALHTDTARVRCEALGALAQARYLSGDHEGALSSVSDALTVAVRNGLELRKMTLRSMFARILAARGHPLTAEQLARTSIKVASRQKIQYAIDHAEATLQAIPRQSGLSGAEDLSGRRDF